MTIGGGGGVENCVTSFLDDPLVVSTKKEIEYEGEIEYLEGEKYGRNLFDDNLAPKRASLEKRRPLRLKKNFSSFDFCFWLISSNFNNFFEENLAFFIFEDLAFFETAYGQILPFLFFWIWQP